MVDEQELPARLAVARGDAISCRRPCHAMKITIRAPNRQAARLSTTFRCWAKNSWVQPRSFCRLPDVRSR
jgi:hypothetical protein